MMYEYIGDLVAAYERNRVLFRKSNKNSTSYRGGIEMLPAEWLREKMTNDQVAAAERLSREIEREIQRVSGNGSQ